jgi:hypothetical protein
MAGDDRDRFRTKTPPAGSSTAEIREHLDRADAARAASEVTPVGMTVIGERTKNISTSTVDIQLRLTNVESRLGDHSTILADQSRDLAVITTKMDIVAKESEASRNERIEREKRAETRAEAELAFRRERTLKIIAVVVPTLVALGGLIAGVIAAINSSGT